MKQAAGHDAYEFKYMDRYIYIYTLCPVAPLISLFISYGLQRGCANFVPTSKSELKVQTKYKTNLDTDSVVWDWYIPIMFDEYVVHLLVVYGHGWWQFIICEHVWK